MVLVCRMLYSVDFGASDRAITWDQLARLDLAAVEAQVKVSPPDGKPPSLSGR